MRFYARIGVKLLKGEQFYDREALRG